MKVLVVGGTGYIGKRIVKASLAQGHTTYVLLRPETAYDIDKLQMVLGFKEQGAILIEASFSDPASLLHAVKQVDVVICTMSGAHSQNLTLQLKLVDAIKEAGNVKRFLPSEFGMDPSRMGHALEPGRDTFDKKMIVRKAIEDAGIPFTYVSANCFGGFFVGNLSQMGPFIPSRDKVCLYGDGSVKEKDYYSQVVVGHLYHIFFEGCLANFEIGEGGEEASTLYPEVQYTRMDEYLKRYV
ncbi:hypothetical protein AQUCO_02200106v1 [Aquilegia coerulea]|uniref:NmrA-like domain-containing protein n=1 Tax=Aquilegia coerulea TaxID=218851 RepID=A0A2G5DDZ2_AQUCA|nr:hypothetical protein AQUCO_02200106v1 [Aquilegia coerulea]